MKSTGTQSSYDLQELDFKIGHQDCSPSNGHHGDIPYLSDS